MQLLLAEEGLDALGEKHFESGKPDGPSLSFFYALPCSLEWVVFVGGGGRGGVLAFFFLCCLAVSSAFRSPSSLPCVHVLACSTLPAVNNV